MRELIWVDVFFCSYSLDVQTDVLLACVEVWEIGCGLVLLDIRVHFVGQDSFQVVIVSRQCCTSDCSLYRTTKLLNCLHFQSCTSCVIPLLPCKRANTKRGLFVRVRAREGTAWSGVRGGGLGGRKALDYLNC